MTTLIAKAFWEMQSDCLPRKKDRTVFGKCIAAYDIVLKKDLFHKIHETRTLRSALIRENYVLFLWDPLLFFKVRGLIYYGAFSYLRDIAKLLEEFGLNEMRLGLNPLFATY